MADSPDALRGEILALRKKSIQPVKQQLPGKPLLKKLILSTVGRLEVGKLVPRHCLSSLLLSSLGDKSLVYCEVEPIELWDFVERAAGLQGERAKAKETLSKAEL